MKCVCIQTWKIRVFSFLFFYIVSTHDCTQHLWQLPWWPAVLGTGNFGQPVKLLTKPQLHTDISACLGTTATSQATALVDAAPDKPASKPSSHITALGPRALVTDFPDTGPCHAAAGSAAKLALDRTRRQAALRMRTTFP